MISNRRRILRVGKSLLLASCFVLALVPRQGLALEISADYRYAIRPSESIEEGKQIAFAEVLRLAIEIAPFFREATADVVDRPLLKKLVDEILSKALCTVEIVEQSVEGRTVYVKVRVRLNEEDLRGLIEAELHQNRALRILDVQVEDNGMLAVTFQALRRLDWLTTAYPGSLREQGDLLVTFYDAQGNPLQTDRFPARKAAANEVLVPGEIAVHRFPIPPGASSYQVEVAPRRSPLIPGGGA
jgi:hypothetical protein